MPKKKPTAPTVIPIYVDGRTMASMLGVSKDQLKVWRIGRRGQPRRLTEGAHWIRLGPRNTRYHVELMRDFAANIERPNLHQKVVERFLAELPSSK